MSDCCAGCAYNQRKTVGDKACPFNALYWDFLARNYEILKQNPRMNLVIALYDKRDPDLMQAIRRRAAEIRSQLQQQKRL
jgi:deoxyribodipyrimidine photolyase-related protein